ncbi:MAG TPA: RNA methyltransferase [Thermoanaerobaculia bacterium]|nr:RNA methyltransferase [Thermoanaerobaculia bacterium]HUM30553.1 RNA methyltransferase [Thermoanaerobaculia bacterium]HXK68745.1 RNA methyltransferase [Thermoanaerobaculia bacterium]
MSEPAWRKPSNTSNPWPEAVQPTVLLVSPKYSGNIGAVARCMKNFGLRDLVLIDPRADRLDGDAFSMASGAEDVLHESRIEETLSEALADYSNVAGTTSLRRRTFKQPILPLREAASKGFPPTDSPWCLVFGPEDRGLSNEELACCSHLITIPSDPDFPTLNLAQSVAITLYEFSMISGSELEARRAASHEERELGLDHLRNALLRIGFLDRNDPDRIIRDLRSLVGRAGATSREMKILRGIARKIERLSRHLPENRDR